MQRLICDTLIPLLLLAGIFVGQGNQCLAVDADVLLRGGTIYDGSGDDGRVGDVAIRGEKIVAVGRFDVGEVKREIDCTGLVISPGFIDLHTHCDSTIVREATRDNLNYLTQGCTSVVTGNCGGGKGDVAAFLDDVDQNGSGTNIAHLVPQGRVRGSVIGSEPRQATEEEITKMQKLVDEGMLAGAWGMSSGLIYAPSCNASTDELARLAERAAAHGGVYATHIRNEGDGLLEAVKEALQIGRDAKLPVHISHFKSAGVANWGRLRDAVALIDQARSQGMKVTADQYPYVASSTGLDSMLLPHAEIPGGRSKLVQRMKNDPELEKKIRELIARRLKGTKRILITSVKTSKWRGKFLDEIAEEEDKDIVDLVLELHALGGVKAVNFCMSENDVCFGMNTAWVATASDGSGHVASPTATLHPRSFGTFSRKIGLFAIEREVIPLARAIRSCSGLPADIFGFSERGYLRPGYYADVVVFDPKTFIDQATFEKPAVYSTGVCHLLLAGNLAIEDGKPSEKLFGRALRHQSTLAEKPVQ